MPRLEPALLVGAFLLALWPVGSGAAGAQGLAVVGATVVDGTGSAPRADAIVLVRGERITAVGPRAEVALPKGIKLIDGRGRFLVPGVLAAPSAAREARDLTAQGLTALQAIATLTRRLGAARAEPCVLEPGRRADLLILDRDPVAEIGNLAAIVGEIEAGQEVFRGDRRLSDP